MARKRESKVMEAGDEVPEPVGAEDDSSHPVLGENAHRLEVYVGAGGGNAFMYEAHAPFPSVDDEAEEIFKELLPLTLGAPAAPAAGERAARAVTGPSRRPGSRAPVQDPQAFLDVGGTTNAAGWRRTCTTG